MYKKIYRPDHPRADVLGEVGEHIIVAEEQILQRPLKKGEIVHHKDWHKPNNALTNLAILPSRKHHQQIPLMQARFLIEQGLMDKFFIWWEKYKDHPKTSEQELEIRLLNAQVKTQRLKRKLEKRNII